MVSEIQIQGDDVYLVTPPPHHKFKWWRCHGRCLCCWAGIIPISWVVIASFIVAGQIGSHLPLLHRRWQAWTFILAKQIGHLMPGVRFIIDGVRPYFSGRKVANDCWIIRYTEWVRAYLFANCSSRYYVFHQVQRCKNLKCKTMRSYHASCKIFRCEVVIGESSYC